MNDAVTRTCSSCGRTLPPGERRCPSCEPFLGLRPRREPALAAVLVLLVVLFAVTTVATRFHHRGQAALAEEWYARGVQALEAGAPGEAIADLRTALVYSRDNRLYRFRLAEALEAAGRRREARAYLLQLWETEPGSGSINLHLARLAAEDGDVPGAIRYYQNAVYGSWERDAEQERRRIRFELVDFLLSRRLRAAAQSELLTISSDLPDAPAPHLRVARQFMQAGAIEPAREAFERVLVMDPGNTGALAGMGQIMFTRGDYRTARRYLAEAAAKAPAREDLADMLQTSELVLDIDPFDRRLRASVRRARTIRAFTQAWTRLMTCLPVGPLPKDAPPRENDLTPFFDRMRQLRPKVTDRGLQQDPDLIDAAMDLVFAVEEATSLVCGSPAGLDRALLVLGRRPEGTAP